MVSWDLSGQRVRGTPIKTLILSPNTVTRHANFVLSGGTVTT
jgi:hypothetical protein